jgi:hypothetical protein
MADDFGQGAKRMGQRFSRCQIRSHFGVLAYVNLTDTLGAWETGRRVFLRIGGTRCKSVPVANAAEGREVAFRLLRRYAGKVDAGRLRARCTDGRGNSDEWCVGYGKDRHGELRYGICHDHGWTRMFLVEEIHDVRHQAHLALKSRRKALRAAVDALSTVAQVHPDASVYSMLCSAQAAEKATEEALRSQRWTDEATAHDLYAECEGL